MNYPNDFSKGTSRDADDTVKKWKGYFEESSGKYLLPWIFSPSYPPEWQPYGNYL